MPSRLMDWAVRSQVWIQVAAASLSPGLHICKMGLMPPTLSLSRGLMTARYVSPCTCGAQSRLSGYGPRRGGGPGGRGKTEVLDLRESQQVFGCPQHWPRWGNREDG